MIHIDCKIITWERISIPDNSLPALKEFLASNPNANGGDFFDWACEMGFDPGSEVLFELIEYMTREENEGFPVTEILQDNIPIIEK